jgi:hypothetical protein
LKILCETVTVKSSNTFESFEIYSEKSYSVILGGKSLKEEENFF